MRKTKKQKVKILNQLFTIRSDNKTITFGLFHAPEAFNSVIPFAGVTHRSPDDKENYKRGVRISVGDAYRNLGRQILKEEYKSMVEQGLNVYNKHARDDIVLFKKMLTKLEKGEPIE
jgi:hypothetical protein